MRKYLFEKANYFLTNNQVKILNETDYSIRLKVGEQEVILKYQNSKLIFICTCKATVFNQICSHSIAAQSYLSWEAKKENHKEKN